MDESDRQLRILADTIQDLANKLGHYIDIHEERYLDLKGRYQHLTRWAQKVAAKTGIPLDLGEAD